MKVAFIADPHVRGKDLAGFERQADLVISACYDRKIDLVCIAGDLFDRSMIGDSTPTGAIVEATMRLMVGLVGVGNASVIMIPGNHDYDGPSQPDALHVFDGMAPAIRVVRRPIIIHSLPMGTEQLSIACLPWMYDGTDPGRWLEGIEADILLGHVQVVGAVMSAGYACPPAPGKWQVSREQLAACRVRRIALGDFHRRQELVPGRGGYVGALRQLNHGESGNPAGLEVWDSATGEAEWIELDGAPRYRTAVITDSNQTPPMPRPGELLRVRYECAPPRADVLRLEQAGATVEQVIEQRERTQRASVPDGALTNPHALIDLFSEVRATERAATDRMHRELQRILGGAKAEPKPPAVPEPAPVAVAAPVGPDLSEELPF